jgi:hypothetical protein
LGDESISPGGIGVAIKIFPDHILYQGVAMKKSTLFFLSVICGLSLAACAQSTPTPAVKPVEIKKEIPAPAVTAPVVTPIQPSAKEAEPMIDLDNPPRGEAIPAVEFKKQILGLIASLQKREHMNREHVEKVLEIVFQDHPRTDNMKIYSGQTKEGWAYNLVLMYTHGVATPSIGIGLINDEKFDEDSLPKICTLDFEDLAKEIVAMGYERGKRPFRNRWGFGKEVSESNTGIGIGIEVYLVDNGSKESIDCVESIHIGSGALK